MPNEKLVFIVDDDQAVRRSVAFMLRQEGYRSESFESGESFLKAVRGSDPGCILLDVRMPGLSGLDVQQELKSRGVALPVIILTGHGDTATAVKAMRAGALNFLEKPYEKSALMSALTEAFAHIERQSDRELEASEAQIRLACLTGRERDVLMGLKAGHPNKTIAFDLGISPRTVEIYRANLMEKLGVRSLSAALRLAILAEAAAPLPED
jgi:two-component system, LuxR family, response regulator FixJ